MAFKLIDTEEDPRFSRSGQSYPWGKLTAEVRVMLTEEHKEQLTGLAVLHGVSSSEYVRDLVVRHLLGELEVLRIAVRQKSVLDRK